MLTEENQQKLQSLQEQTQVVEEQRLKLEAGSKI
jgi:hypothetical protein